MSTKDDETGRAVSVATDEELRRLAAAVADALRRGAQPESRPQGFWDKFWERLPPLSTFVGSVVLGAVALMFNSNYNDEQRREREAQSEFERQKFVAEERDRQRRIVIELGPKILSEKQVEREGGQAMLSHFFPGEAPHILRDITKGETASEQNVAQAIAKAEETARVAGAWGVVVGQDDTLASAQDEQRRAEALGFAVTIYKKGGGLAFYTVAQAQAGGGGFDSITDAEAANFTIGSKIRRGAYVTNLKKFCPHPREQQGYVECHPNAHGAPAAASD